LAARPASAHDFGFYDLAYWGQDLDHVPVYFDNEFPRGRPRSRVANAAREWNDVGRNDVGRRVFFNVHRSPSITSGADTAPGGLQAKCPTAERDGRNVSLVHWGQIDGPTGPTIGQTAFCWVNFPTSTRLRSFRLYFDRTEDWYMGTGDSAVKNKKTGEVRKRLDFWATATHEMGHATGWIGHWNRKRAYCDYTSGKPFRTMCGSAQEPGREVERTLTWADKHVFKSRYEAR